MRSRSKYLILITLALSMLLSVVLVSAQFIPIGDTVQTVPFESNPTAYSVSGYAGYLSYPQRAYDTVVTGTAARCMMRLDYTRNLTYSGFERPSDLWLEEFSIGWVDFKIRYALSAPTVGDRFRFTYKVGASADVILQDWINGTTEYGILGTDTLAQTWHNPPEPLDGTWTWGDIANLELTVEDELVTDDAKTLYIYEIWLSVYPLPLPPSASTACSIQPVCVDPIELWGDPWVDVIFVDVYVKDIELLAGWEFVLHYNSSVLEAMEGWVYWPFTDTAWIDMSVAGIVNMASSIDTTSPLVDTGWNGSSPLARIYFSVFDVDEPNLVNGFTWLTFSKMKTDNPVPVSIPHADYHGCYGTPPEGKYLLVWQATSEFPWYEPNCTYWVENCPELGPEFHLTSWEDNDDDVLSASDQIDMLDESGEWLWWFHVDIVGVVTPTGNVYMILTFKEKTPIPEFPLGIEIIMILTLLTPLIYLWRRKRSWKK